ncbi:MAG: serine hydrolase domain-containing protein [Bacteroidota bacterium]
MKHQLPFLLLFFTHLLIAQDQPALSTQIDTLVHQRMQQYQIPGLAIGVVQGNEVLYRQGYGIRDIETQAPVTAQSIFHTASISKLLTAQAVMQLQEARKLDLDDKVIALLPQLQIVDERFHQVTVRQVLNHTAGLPDIKNYRWGRQHESIESLDQYMLSHKFRLRAEPGRVYQYSNLGYDLLGYLIQEVSGVSFEDFMQEQVLRPANMLASDFRYFRIPGELRVSPHTRRRLGGKIVPRPTYPYTREHAPSSTLNASAEELCYWMQFVLKDVGHGDESRFQSMLQPSIPASPYIGLGFQLFAVEGQAVAGHFGGDQGFRSYLLLVPEKDLGLVLLANCDYNEDFRQAILHSVLSLLLK